MRARQTFGVALGVLLGVCAGSGCASSDDQLLTRWQLESGSGAAAAAGEIELPGNLEGRLPHERSTYVLRTRLELAERWRGRELTLIVPAFDGLISARVDGSAATSVGLEAPRRYRQPGPHRFTLPATASEDGVLELELVVEHRWTGSAWFGAAPRVVPAGQADLLTWLVWIFNLVVPAGALVALFQIAITSATVYFTDRRREPYLLFGAQAFAAQIYPLHVLGLTQLAFGRFDVFVLGLSLIGAILGSVYFTHSFFDLPRPSRWFVIGAAIAAAPLVALCWSFDLLRYLGPPTIIYLAIVAGYQVVTCIRLYWSGRDRRSARYLMLSWVGLAVSCLPDFVAWTGLADPLHGVRLVNVGLGMFALLLSLLFSQRHIIAMAESDLMGGELVARVAELERNRAEIEQLNLELRRQLTVKSSQIYAALMLPEDRPAGRAMVKVGDVIDHRYLVEGLLGAGGMGNVYQVLRVSDGRRLALKLTQEHSGRALARLAREALVALTVAHENVVEVVDVDVATAGFLYIVMELVEGSPLREARRAEHDLAWSVDVLCQIARGLAALHDAGIVHRDLKPANVLLTDATEGDVRVKISDFGISLGNETLLTGESSESTPGEIEQPPAAASSEDSSLGEATVKMPYGRSSAPPRREEPAVPHAPLTHTGLLPGTPAYIAPELVAGRSHVSPAADVFAFGVIAYELLTGAQPFQEPPALAILSGREPIWPAPLAQRESSVLPAALGELVDQCLAAAPEARPTAVDIVVQLEALAELTRPSAATVAT